MSQPSNDEFIKNVEQERDSIIKWANKRIDKLNAILEIAKNDDELPKADKAKIAATAGDDIRLAKAKELLNNPNIPQHDKTHLQEAVDYAQKTRHPDTGHLTGTGAQSLENANRSAEQHISYKGSPDDTGAYVPDDTTDLPDEGDGSCDSGDCDSDCDSDAGDLASF